jgi:hypothetical protein
MKLKDIVWGMYNGKDYVPVSFPHLPSEATVDGNDDDTIREALEELIGNEYYPLDWRVVK